MQANKLPGQPGRDSLTHAAAVPPELLEALARGVAAAFAPPPAPAGWTEPRVFVTAGRFAGGRGFPREGGGGLATANVLPSRGGGGGSRKTPRRYPRRFADEFAASGLDV